MTTRIEGARSTRVRFSTGRAAELRAVPSFRAMVREGLIEEHDLADLNDALAGELELSRLDSKIEDALIVHLFIEPPLSVATLGVLDDVEIAEAISFALTAHLNTRPRMTIAEDDEEDEEEPDPSAAGPLGVNWDEMQEQAEAAIAELKSQTLDPLGGVPDLPVPEVPAVPIPETPEALGEPE